MYVEINLHGPMGIHRRETMDLTPEEFAALERAETLRVELPKEEPAEPTE